jgi:hypothetical protein
VHRINLVVYAASDVAVRLYQSVGFVAYGRESEALCINGVYFDALLMSYSTVGHNPSIERTCPGELGHAAHVERLSAKISMAFLVSAVLPFFVAGLTAIAYAASWREQLAKPVAYGLVCFLLVLGLHYLVSSLVELVRNVWPLGGGYSIVVRPTTEGEITAMQRQMTLEGLAIAVAVAVLSYPLVALIRGGFAK